MSGDLDMPAAASVRRVPPLKAFYWLVRRELWEHPAVLVAPLAVAGFAVLAHFLSALTISDAERLATLSDPAKSGQFQALYAAAIGAILILGLVVGALYSLDALQGERRDRSILFWKSLPVSDLMTVLAKAFIPVVVLPLASLAAAIGANLVMAPLQSLAWMGRGYDPADLWARVDLVHLWSSLALGLPFIALWYAPLYAWFLLVSAWARRAAILWALAPFAAFLMVEHLALHNTPAHWALERRLAGGILYPYTLPDTGEKVVWVEAGGAIDWGRVYSAPDLWIGLVVAGLFLFAASRLRRSRPPL